MGRREITVALGKELAITKYASESNKDYLSRLTYTALGLWSRFLASVPDGSEKNAGNISKAAHHRKIAEYLKRFMLIYDDIEEYFQDDDPVSRIRSPLISSMDLHEIGFESRLALGEPCTLPVDTTHAVTIGKAQIPPGAFSSGLAFLVPTMTCNSENRILSHWGIPESDAESFLVQIINDAKWEPTSDLKNCEFFDISRQGVFSSCWAQFVNLSSNPCIARKKLAYGRPEYFLVKQEGGRVLTSSFSEFSQHEAIRDTQRVMYAMKARGKCYAVVNVDIYRQYSIWHFWSKLPPQEERFLRYIGWPKNSITNRTSEFVVRNEFSNIVSTIASNLGIVKKETRHE